MARRHTHQGRPHLLYALTEWRAMFELATLPYAWPWLQFAPRGDGHPVLLLPGFMGDDATMFALKMFLRGRGYDVHTWGLGRNVGLQSRHLKALEEKVRYLHHETGRKVSLVGWSLGGVFALYAAQHATDCVRSIITLGSPVSTDPTSAQANSLVISLYRWIAHPHGPHAHGLHPKLKRLRDPLQVPISCLYSVGDGVVPPQEATLDGDPARHENIRIPGSHLGLAVNALVLAVVANRLAQPEDGWKPFVPQGLWGQAYRIWAGDDALEPTA